MSGQVSTGAPNEAAGFGAVVAATREKFKQNKDTPLVINVTDGRLLPNTVAVSGQPDGHGGFIEGTRDPNYVPYHGDPKATLEERMKWLRTANTAPRRVIFSASAVEPERIDLDKMSKEQLINFAASEFSMKISAQVDIKSIRKMILAANGTPAPAAAAKADVTSTDDAIG
jgi:hypothetical protein